MSEKKRRKILFVIPSMGGGGAERILVSILRYLDRERFSPHLALFEKKGEFLDILPEDIIVFDLKKRSRMDFFKLVVSLAFDIYPKLRPDAVVSFLEYTNMISAMAKRLSRSKPLLFMGEQNCLSLDQKQQRMRIIRKSLVRRLYPEATKIIAASYGVKTDLIQSFGIMKDKIQVIYNGLDLDLIKRMASEPVNCSQALGDGYKTIAACGRLAHQKNYPLLLRGFAKVQRDNRARLLILGKGELRNSLKELAGDLGIADRVVFLGFQQNPFKFIARSSLFVLSSDWEGFGLVIVEAMTCGVPVISTRCPAGPDEIITDGVNGLLVPAGDVDALAGAMSRLLGDVALRQKLACAGKKRAQDFRVEEMVKEYERILAEGPAH